MARCFGAFRGLVLWGSLTALVGCGFAKPYPALRISEQSFREQVKTICMEELQLSGAPEEMQPRIDALQSLIGVRLEELGFQVVTEDQSKEVAVQVARAEGGFFDPHTGRRDEARYAVIRARALAAMKTQLGCDAVLVPTISIVSTTFVNGVALWDGVSDDMSRDFFGGGTGYAPALSLWIRIRDMQDEEIYFRPGGIQVLSTLKSGFWEATFEFVADDALLADEDRNREAVVTSLAPLDPAPRDDEEPIHPALRPKRDRWPTQ